jgi:hypothetical protein
MSLLVSSKTSFVTQILAYAIARYRTVIQLTAKSTSPISASAVQTSIVAIDTRLTILEVTLAHALVTHQLAKVTWQNQPGSLEIATANAISLFAHYLSPTLTHLLADANALQRHVQMQLQLSTETHALVYATSKPAQEPYRTSTKRLADVSA